MDNLILSLEAWQKQNRSISVYNDNGVYTRVWRDIAHSYDSWPEQATALVSRGNWNIEALRLADGKFRRPKAYLSVEITDKGNLALEWYPIAMRTFPASLGDWKEWDNQWPVGGASLPMSRIIFIHDFHHCFTPYRSRTFNEAEEYLGRALRDLLDVVYRFLGQVIEVEIVNDLYLDYSDSDDYYKRVFLGASVRNAVEHDKERAERSRQKWLTKTFTQELGIEANDLITTFKAVGEKYVTTAKNLQPSLKGGAKLSGDKVKRLIEQLREKFPEYFTDQKNSAEDTPLRTDNVVLLKPQQE